MAGLTIGRLAAGEGVGVETVRFYQLTLLQGRLRRLVRVCAHGDGLDCVALHVGEPLADASPDRVASAAHEVASATSAASEGAMP